MTPTRRYTDDDIDALVGSVLREEADAADIETTYSAIEARLKQDAAAPQPARRLWILSDSLAPLRRLAIAAGIVLVFVLGWWVTTPAAISAHAVVLAAHERAVKADRRYLVKFDVPRVWHGRNFLVRTDWDTVVWSRGDRFRAIMQAPDRVLTFGQDGKKNVWLVADEDPQGMQFAKNEVPPNLFAARTMLCLDVGELTKRFADDYQLEYQAPKEGDDPELAVILATAKPESKRSYTNFVHRARLLVDRETHVIQEMQLFRTLSQQREASLTFTLAEQAELPDEIYELVGNLPPDGEVLDKRRAAERKAAYQRLQDPKNWP